MKKDFPIFEVVTGDSAEDCAKMVESGEVDFFAQNVNVVKPLLENPHYENLSILPISFMSENMGFTSLLT